MSTTACSVPLGHRAPLPRGAARLGSAGARHLRTLFCSSLDFYVWLGLKKILEVGSTVCGVPGSLPVTENSRMSASVLLSKLYDDLKCDAERENFHHLCEDYVR